MSLTDIYTDVLATHVLSSVQPSVLFNFLTSSKEFYCQRKIFIKNNKRLNDYAEYDKKSYFSVILGSNLELTTTIQISKPLYIDSYTIRNTSKILMYDVQLKPAFSNINNYYTSIIRKEFGYKQSNKCTAILYNYFNTEHWQKSNIIPYDIYKIVYHIIKRKYMLLQDTLRNMEFVGEVRIIETVKLLMDIIDNIKDERIKVSLLYVMYNYFNCMSAQLLKPSYINFVAALKERQSYFVYATNKINKLPKYIKELIINKINTVTDAVITQK